MNEQEGKNKFPVGVVQAYTVWQGSRSEIDFQSFLESLRQNATLVPKGIVSGDVRSALAERFPEAAALPGFREAVDSIMPGRPHEASPLVEPYGLQDKTVPAPIPVAHESPNEPDAFKSRKPRKKRIALIVVLVALVAAAIALTAYALSVGLIGDKALVRRAETHYAAARSAITAAASAIESASDSDDYPAAEIEDARKVLAKARREVVATRRLIEQLDDSQGKTEYLAAIASAAKSVDAMESAVKRLTIAKGVYVNVARAASAVERADRDTSDAISAGNSAEFARMQREARAAGSGFAAAAVLIRRAHRFDKSGGLDKWARKVDLQKRVAGVLARMADSGSYGDATAYDRGVDRAQRLGARIDRVRVPSDLFKVVNRQEKRVSALTGAASVAREKAEELHAKALKALGYSSPKSQ